MNDTTTQADHFERVIPIDKLPFTRHLTPGQDRAEENRIEPEYVRDLWWSIEQVAKEYDLTPEEVLDQCRVTYDEMNEFYRTGEESQST